MDPMTMAMLAQGIPTNAKILNYLINPPRLRLIDVARRTQAAREAGMQDANTANSLYGTQMGARFAGRGLGNSGIADNSLASFASKNYQQVTRSVNSLRDQLEAEDERRRAEVEDHKRSALEALLTGFAQDAATGLGTYAGMKEEDIQQQKYMDQLKSIFGEDQGLKPTPAYGSDARIPRRRLSLYGFLPQPENY